MLSKHPNPEREEPATSPALARRRDHMLRSDAMRHIEPRLVPSADDGQPSFLPEPNFEFAEDESDPEIPPPPIPALAVGSVNATERMSRSPHRPRLWPVGAAAAAVIAIGAAAWLVYDRTPAAPGSGDVPYVAAEAGPEKVRPQQEGGIEVPNQDIRVYNELNGSKPAQESEVLLPPPEAPVTPPAAASAKPPAAQPTAAAPSVPTSPLDVAPSAGTNAQPDETPAAATAGEPTAPATVSVPVQTATTTGAFRIQLAAVKTQDAAQAAWKKILKTNPDVLKGLKLNVVKVDRGADGALFRVQGGPFADRGAAESACGKLKQKNQACLVVAP
jgi:cell division septation protein DedD